ncbi:MAG: Rpn family recombination-promoting nuclease/putative transposase, partial [Spirochaetaceae bacterium]|nr:Rpn family recombination-promoting nuclease/putative transposase [Spirochaetaceae bacterium]
DEEYEIILIDPHLKKEAEDDKLGILDVCLKSKSGKIINVEIQLADIKAFFERICFYRSKLIVGQIGEGMWYDAIKKTICIVITEFSFIESADKTRYHHIYRLHDPADDTYFGDVEEIHTLELPKMPGGSDGSKLWDWALFFNAKTEEELNMIATRNREVGRAVKALYKLSADDEVRLRYEAREKAWRDEQGRIAFGIDKGIKQGLEQGIKQGIKQGREEGREEGLGQGREEVLELLRCGESLESILHRYDTKTIGGKYQ